MKRKIEGWLPVVLLFCVAVSVSCAEGVSDPFSEDVQAKSLDAWMRMNHPELVANYQENGGYYVEVINAGDLSGDPISSMENGWVRYDILGRTLQGDVCLTRDSLYAKQQGTFTKYTHYVPYFQFAGEPYYDWAFKEGVFLAMRNPLKLGADYAAQHDLPEEFELREGSEVVLYMPATVVSTSSANGDGGYEGQYELSANRPMIARIKIIDLVENPIREEGLAVDDFAKANGDFNPNPDAPDNDAYTWKIASRQAAQVYINRTFNPADETASMFTYTNPYYGSQQAAEELDRKINAALVERFGAGDPGQIIQSDENVYIWYVIRFLDGFVADTNIDEVKQIIYGNVESTGRRISYTPANNKDAQLGAWYYALPGYFRFGSWGAIVTPSSNGYGYTGIVGKTVDTSSSSYSSYTSLLNYYSSSNSSLSPDLTGNYYYDFYDLWPGGYEYTIYQGSTPSVTSFNNTATSNSTVTEILPYTPLLIEFYIEPKGGL